MTTFDEVRAVVRDIYIHGPLVPRTIQRLRPYICPFEALVDAIPTGSTVLDVGCGAGLFLGLLVKLDHIASGYGFDVSHQSIDLANMMKLKLPKHTPVLFEQRSTDAPWPAGMFDVISMIDVMHHIHPAQQADVFSYVVAKLRPGGIFVYKDMVQRPLWRAWANRLHDLILAKQWIHYLPLDIVENLAAEAGLRLITKSSENRLWYGHELAVFQLDLESTAGADTNRGVQK